MKIFLSVFLLCSLMTNEVISDDKVGTVHKQPSCEGKGCYVVATKASWEKIPLRRGLRVKTGPFVVKIPSNVSWVGLGNTVNVFRYDNAPHIVIGMETNETLELTKDINPSQALEVIFSHTPKDLGISSNYDRELWNKLMLMKKGFLERSEKAFIFRKSSIIVYFIRDAGNPYNNIAWAVDTENPDAALRIESNMNATKFKEIMFSIKLKEN